MTLKNAWKAVLLLATLTGIACGQEPGDPSRAAPESTRTNQQAVTSTNKVLILGSSVSGLDSREVQAVRAADPTTQIDVVTPERWKALTAEEFMAYRALIIGDAACQSGTAAFQAAIDSRNTWGAIVDGDVAILGTDPTHNNTPQLVESAIEFVLNSQQKRTGMYIALGCAYQEAPANTAVTLLEPFGRFTVQGVPGCADSAHMLQMRNDLLSRFMTDDMLSGDGCAARSVFTSYPDHNFAFAALAMSSSGTPLPAQSSYTDVIVNPDEATTFASTPYIVVRGAMAEGAGCGYPESTSAEECDLGDGINGNPAVEGQLAMETCSWSCHLHWCGDGVVDTEFGEECDEGINNGRTDNAAGHIGTCTSFCKFPNLTPPAPAPQPPTALCHNVTQVAEYTCGVSANIDNGSYDADGDLVGCTQSPAGPYAIGDTTVTLTCTDQAEHTSSCTGVVTVVDHVAPTVALTGPANQAVECVAGGTYAEPGSTASDLCAGSLPASSISRTGSVNPSVPATYSLSYVATDAAGNASSPVTRTVTVADTQKPVVTVSGALSVQVECGSSSYVDPGATASDACAGTLPAVASTTPNRNVPGTYSIRYSATDPSGNVGTSSSSRTVTVSDTLPPTLTLNGAASATLQCGVSYTDPGATASDACAGNLTPNITVTSNLDTAHSGQYSISYRVSDPAGHVTTAVRQLTVGPCSTCLSIHLSDYTLFLLENYNGGHDIEGKTAAGGNIILADFSMGSHLPDTNLSNALVAGGNLSLVRGGVWGDAWYGGTFSADTTVVYPRGTVRHGTPIDFAAKFAELRNLSAQLASRTANGTTTREVWGGVMLRGTNPSLNVFNVSASAFTGAVMMDIQAPAGSLAVINIRGASASFSGFGISLSGGIDQHGVLYNFVDTTSIYAHGFGFPGTLLAPYARVNFTEGSWNGGLYAVSMDGNAEGHFDPMTDRNICP
ncbi:MAG: choice-of-anchor A family protein [Hyalangium sp.]|uniref:choice-of-anchor A family protein n=1 Tax=Hyalangium sp. TaxID=2028555 RepID=UPI00389A14EE